jgi:glucose uptake protein
LDRVPADEKAGSLVLPTTWLSAFLFLILSLVCLGSWANTFKATGSRWRFELFSIDFAVGALLFSLIAAYTLGTLGSELGFSDRMLVAGRTNQALGLVAGALFALGNMLLLAAISLLGMSAAFPLCIGSAVAVAALVQFRGAQGVWLLAGVVLLVAALVFDIAAIRRKKTPARAATAKGPAKKAPTSTRGIIVGIIAGVVLGCFFVVIQRGFRGDFGLGPYAGLLLVSIALLVSTLVLNLYFMNIAISGGPIGFGAYFTGQPFQHFFGFAGGAVWALGMLAQGLAMSAPVSVNLNSALIAVIPLVSVLLAVFWGFTKWKEYPGGGKALLFVSAALFLAGVALVGVAFTVKAPVLPSS